MIWPHPLNKKVVRSETSDSRKVGGLDGGLDDACIDGHDGEHHTGEEDQGQLVDVLDSHKHHQSHEDQAAGPIDAHVIQHGHLLSVGLLRHKQRCIWHYVSLARKGGEARSKLVQMCKGPTAINQVRKQTSVCISQQ